MMEQCSRTRVLLRFSEKSSSEENESLRENEVFDLFWQSVARVSLPENVKYILCLMKLKFG